MGMRENWETVQIPGGLEKIKPICTVGGAFPAGGRLIKKVRALNNYFNTPQRVNRLTEVQQFYGYPELQCVIDCDTRVGSTIILFTRSILNYKALRDYFEMRHPDDDPSVFETMTRQNWRLLTEMESIVYPLANLAPFNVQRSDLVGSELIVMIKSAYDRLSSNKFDVCCIEETQNLRTKEASFPRREMLGADLSEDARKCAARLKGQVEKRVTTLSPQNVLILLLDPRTKFSVSTIMNAGPSATHTTGTMLSITKPRGSDDVRLPAQFPMTAAEGYADTLRKIVDEGNSSLQKAHREAYCTLHKGCANDNSGSPKSTPSFDSVPCVDDEAVMCGAPIPNAPQAQKSRSALREEADKVLEDWLKLRVRWVDVAVEQSLDARSESDFAHLMFVWRGGVVSDRLEGVMQHVDICRWFRDVGSFLFPSIAALARVWLGRSPSNAFQERVFSTGGLVMAGLRTSTDNSRAEMQVLLKHNKNEIACMEVENDERRHSTQNEEAV